MALRRPYIVAQDLYLPAPTGGWNPDVHPWELPDSQAYQLDNLIPRAGKVVMRGGIAPLYDPTPAISPGPPMNAMGFYAGIGTVANPADVWSLITRSTGTGVDAADAIWGHTLTGHTQADINGVMNNPSTGIASFGFSTQAAVPGPRWIEYAGLIYTLGFASTGTLLADTNVNYKIPPTVLMTWSTHGVGGTSALTFAPHGAIDVTSYQNRIFLLGGVDTPAGASVHHANTLWFTNPGGLAIGSIAADWEDPISGTTNFITIDTDSSDPPVGLARVRNGLLIFRRNSIYILRGAAESAYQVTQLANEVGCVDQRSILETDTGVYFMSLKGLMVTDGIAVQNVSSSITNTLQIAITAARGDVASHGYATTALLPGGSIIISLGLRSGGTGNMTSLFSAVLDRQTNTWWRLTSNVLGAEQTSQTGNLYPGMLFYVRNPLFVVSLGNAKPFDLTQIENAGRSTTQAMYDSLGTGGPQYRAIPATWMSKLLPTTGGANRTIHTSKHLYLDYVFTSAGGALPNAWEVQVLNTSRTRIGDILTVNQGSGATSAGWVSGVQNLAAPIIQRQGQDMIDDITDTWVQVDFFDPTLRSSLPSAAIAELYGVGLSILPGPNEPVT